MAVETMSINKLKVGNFQVWPSMLEETFEQLKADIRESGQIYPIIVDENYVIIDGHHRYKALSDCGIAEAIVRIYSELDEDGKLEIAFKSNTTNRIIPREEKIRKAKELRSQGRSIRQIAKWLGVGKSTINRWLNPAESVPRGTKDVGSQQKFPSVEEIEELRAEISRLQFEKRQLIAEKEKYRKNLAEVESERDLYKGFASLSTDRGIAVIAHFVGLSEDATIAEIEKAFKRARGKVHPDAGGNTWVSARYNDSYDVFRKIYRGA